MKNSMQRNLDSVYEYIKDFRDTYGYPPSIREIKSSLNIKSTSSVHSYLKKLNNQGLITIKGKNKSRAIDLVEKINTRTDIFHILPEIRDVSEINKNLNNKSNYIISKSFFPSYYPLFLYVMQGYEMSEAGIMDNDKLIVKKQSFANNGDIVLCRINDEIKVKRCNIENNKAVFSPMNKQINRIQDELIEICGLVVGLIRHKL